MDARGSVTIGVAITAAAATEIRTIGSVLGVRAGSLYGSYSDQANELQIAEATAHTDPSERGFPLVGGWWQDPTSVGARPELAEEQSALWASYLTESMPLYAALFVIPESTPNEDGWANAQACAWVARTVGPVATAVEQAPVRFEAAA